MSEPVWIGVAEALAAHSRTIAVHGGPDGVRDRGLLESALARPRQRAAYEDVDLVTLAATYTESIVRNHPLVDGNKRTGFVIGLLFLARNGLTLEADPVEAAHMVISLAGREIDCAACRDFLAPRIRPRVAPRPTPPMPRNDPA